MVVTSLGSCSAYFSKYGTVVSSSESTTTSTSHGMETPSKTRSRQRTILSPSSRAGITTDTRGLLIGLLPPGAPPPSGALCPLVRSPSARSHPYAVPEEVPDVDDRLLGLE